MQVLLLQYFTIYFSFFFLPGQTLHKAGALPALGPPCGGPEPAHLLQDLQLSRVRRLEDVRSGTEKT